MVKSVLNICLFGCLLTHTLAAPAVAQSDLPYVAGHKTACLSYDEVAWDPLYGAELQRAVDNGYFADPETAAAVSELAYSLMTPKSVDPANGSARLLLSQIWYPVSPAAATSAEPSTWLDIYSNDAEGQPLAYDMSLLSGIVRLLVAGERGDYPNAEEGYGDALYDDPETREYIVNGPLGSLEGAPVAIGQTPFPLVILESIGNEQRHLAEELASRGYVVIATAHPGDRDSDGLLDVGSPLDGTPINGIPYGLNCSEAEINAAKPVNGILDFDVDIPDVWRLDGGVYMGLARGDIQESLRYRAIDVGMLIARASEFFDQEDIVDNTRTGLLGFSRGGATAQLIVSDDAVLNDPALIPATARAGMDEVDAVVTLAGNNRFKGNSSNASLILKPTLAMQGRDDLNLNRINDISYGGGTLREPNPVFKDNYRNRYAPGVPAMRVLIDRFGFTDFQAGSPVFSCVEHGGSETVPENCVSYRPVDERNGLKRAKTGGLEIGGTYVARPLEERLDISMSYINAWFDLYVRDEICSEHREYLIDGKVIGKELNNLKRLRKNHFRPASIQRRHRNLRQGNAIGTTPGGRC